MAYTWANMFSFMCFNLFLVSRFSSKGSPKNEVDRAIALSLVFFLMLGPDSPTSVELRRAL